MGSGRLFHKDGPMCVKVCKTTCVCSTARSKFKDFIQTKRTVVTEKLESYCFYALVNSATNLLI